MSFFQPIGAHIDGTDISSAVTLTRPTSLADGIAKILIQAISQNVRVTMDGTTPTATTGFQIAAGETLYWEIGPGATIKVIEEASGADIQIQWGK